MTQFASIFIFLCLPFSLLSQQIITFYENPSRLFGYMTLEGDTLLPANYCQARPFHSGLAIVHLCQSQYASYYTQIPALIDTKGNILFKLEKRHYFPVGAIMKNNRIPVFNPTKDFGYYNIRGEEVIPFQYEKAWSFGENLAAVKERETNTIHFIDTTGKKIFQLPEGYELMDNSSYRFSEGLIAVVDKSSGLMGFMNKKGELVIKCQFDQVGNFSEGKAYAAMITNSYMNFVGKNRMGYINEKGEWVIELPHKTANLENGCYFEGSEFNDGMARMCIRENDGDCVNYGCLSVDENGKVFREDWE